MVGPRAGMGRNGDWPADLKPPELPGGGPDALGAFEVEVIMLRAGILGCGDCRLRECRLGAGAVPPYVGPDYSPGGILLLSERPGPAEGDAQEPMVGRAGALLNRLLFRADLDRQEVAISNKIRCRPPEDRLDEVPEALFACDTWTRKEVETLLPSVCVLLGGVAIQGVYGPDTKVGQVRRKPRVVASGLVYVPTYNPAHALRNRQVEDLIVEDLALAKELRDG